VHLIQSEQSASNRGQTTDSKASRATPDARCAESMRRCRLFRPWMTQAGSRMV
jgi:hypothetical protein